MVSIVMSKFAKGRHTPEQPFSHFNGTDEQIVQLVRDNIPYSRDGYREGVMIVPVSPEGFFTSTVKLEEGARLIGEFKPRRQGEAPRKSIGVMGGKKLPAEAVDIILYSKEVLVEDGESSGADWEIVSINAKPAIEEEPMHPSTLMANHFHVNGSNDGGTSTNMSPAEFEAALKTSYEYWKDKAMMASPELIVTKDFDAKKLAKLISEGLEKDTWGAIDPWYIQIIGDDVKLDDDENDDHASNVRSLIKIFENAVNQLKA